VNKFAKDLRDHPRLRALAARCRGEIAEPEVAKTDEVLLLEQIRDLLAERRS
jgi:hypothetical protein